MAESGFQHHRFLQTVGRGRLSADINRQSFICLPWKSYSISPGEHHTCQTLGTPALGSVTESLSWRTPQQAHSPHQVPNLPCAVPWMPGALPSWAWVVTGLSPAQSGTRRDLWNCTPAWQPPARWVPCLGTLGSVWTADHSSTIWSWSAKHPRNICKETKISLSIPVNYIHLTFTFKKQCPPTSTWLIAKV